LLKPEAVRWRAALLAAQQGEPVPALPPQGAVLQKTGNHAGLRIAGFRRCASGWLRIDMAEKLARQAHAARIQAAAPPTSPVVGGDAHHQEEEAGEDVHAAPPPGFAIDPALATSLGLDEEARRALLASFGFRSVGDPLLQRWRWSGLKIADKGPRRKRGKPNEREEARARSGPAGERPHPPAKQGKGRRGKPAKPPKPSDSAGRAPRADRPQRRGPSPNSPFAGLAAMLAEARKD
jgi:ATP-dependent RNA helicase SUPV3L1/SUV3